MNLIYFELKKVWQTRKTHLFLLLSLSLIIVLFFFNGFMAHKEQQEIAEVNPTAEALNQKSFNDKLKHSLEEMNQEILMQEETFQIMANERKPLDGKLTLPTYPLYRMNLNDELVKKKLPPQSMRYGTKNSIFTAILVSYLASGLGLIILFLLFGDSLTKEMEDNSLYFYLAQPIQRGRLFLTKYILTWAQSVVVIGLFLVFGFIFASVFSGGSSFFYPVIAFSNMNMDFIPIIQYIGQVYLLFTFVLAFCFSLHFLVSIFLKKTSLSLIITMVLLFEGYSISMLNSEFTRKIAPFNPFIYLNSSKIFVGYDFHPFATRLVENQEYYANWCLPRTIHNAQISNVNGMITLSIGTAILLLIGYFCFKKNFHLWKE